MNIPQFACAGMLLLATVCVAVAQSVPALINFQGQVQNPDGTAPPTADYELSFRIYDAAQGGTLIWGPQVFDGTSGPGKGPKIPIVQGYFNVMLGQVDATGRSILTAFSTSIRFLEIKMGTNAPISPRQQILSAPYAVRAGGSDLADNAGKLAGHDWTPVFGTNNPSGPLPASKLADGSLPATKLVPSSVSASQLAPKSITAAQIADSSLLNVLLPNSVINSRVIAPGSITTDKIPDSAVTGGKIASIAIENVHLSPGAVSWDKLAFRSSASPNAGLGQVGLSVGTGNWVSPTPRAYTKVPGLDVVLTCTGRPIHLYMAPQAGGLSILGASRSSGNNSIINLKLNRVTLPSGPTNLVAEVQQRDWSTALGVYVSPGCFQFFDVPPSGQHRYEIEATGESSNATAVTFDYVRMVTYEL